jgi:hypothetical protein
MVKTFENSKKIDKIFAVIVLKFIVFYFDFFFENLVINLKLLIKFGARIILKV